VLLLREIHLGPLPMIRKILTSLASLIEMRASEDLSR